MATVWGNEDVACYFTTKHSWRGKWVEAMLFGEPVITFYAHVVFSFIAFIPADFHGVTCRYKRIFSIGTKGITTYNPTNLEVTNQVRDQTFIHVTIYCQRLIKLLSWCHFAERVTKSSQLRFYECQPRLSDNFHQSFFVSFRLNVNENVSRKWKTQLFFKVCFVKRSNSPTRY